MNRYELYEYVNAGCMYVEDSKFEKASPHVGAALHGFTNGKMCDTGCPVYNNGNCAAYKKMTARYEVKTKPSPLPRIETVRNEAKRRGVSIKQVRRERREEMNDNG